MAKLADTLNTIGAVAGLDAEALKAITTAAGTTEIDDAHHGTLTTNLITVDLAKNNMDLQNHFVGKFSEGFNQSFTEDINSFEILKPETKAEILAEKSTGKRNKLAFTALKKRHAELMAEAKSGDASVEAKKQIDQLRLDLSKANEAGGNFDERAAAIRTEEQGKASVQITSIELDSIYASKPWAAQYPAETRSIIAKNAINTKLAQIGGVLVRISPGQYKVVNDKDPSLEVLVGSKKVTFQSIQDEVLAPYLSKNPLIPATPVVIPKPTDGPLKSNPKAAQVLENWNPYG